MEEQSSRMVQLVEDLLSLSRIEQKEHILPEEEIALESVIASAIEINRSVAEKTGMEIKYNREEGKNVFVRGSHNDLTQALSNLLHNAIVHGATKDGARQVLISIGADALEGQEALAIYIKDYRINPEESRKLGGTGLGLAIVKHILTRHRGELRIQSKQGEGSTFCAVLPKK
jgi:two-component system phosphate regulon sensor histidine kinase PhoR